MLEAFHGSKSVGLYGAVYKLFENISIIPSLIAATIFPVIVRLIHNKDYNKLFSLINRCQKIFLLIGIFLAIFFLVEAKQIVLFFFGEKFADAGYTLRILATGIFIFFVNALMGKLLFASYKEKKYLKWVTISLFLNISLNLLLDEKNYHFTITPRNPDEPHMFQTEHFNLSYSLNTPLTIQEHVHKITLFFTAFDRALARYRPKLITF